jgi:hypothetical protein
MSPLDALAPDQRAVVALVLQQGRSYEDIADMLGLPVAGVRARAHAGLRSLAPDNALPDEVTAPLADYLLGRQSPADAAATRGLLAESAPLRSWAQAVARSLEADVPGGLPDVPDRPGEAAPGAPAGAAADTRAADEIPGARGAEDAPRAAVAGDRAAAAGAGAAAAAAATAEQPAASPPPARPLGDLPPEPAAPPSSRLGGVVLIAGVLAVVAIVLVFVVRGGSDEKPAEPASVATATPTPTAAASTTRITDRIPLRPVGDSRATGRMTVFLQDARLLFQLQARNVPPSGRRSAYAVWFTGPGSRARRLGYTDPVGADGRLGIQGPSDSDLETFPRLYATYAYVVVSRETDSTAQRPADPVLRGLLPKGR